MINWQEASDYLSRGRKKWTRPLYDRGLYLSKVNKYDPDSDIVLHTRWHPEPFITYHKDGSMTLVGASSTGSLFITGTWYPMKSYSVRFSMSKYSGLTLFQKNNNVYIVEQNPTLSPSKIQGCRTCSQTGRQPGWCYPKTCFNATYQDDKWYCQEHEMTPSSNFARWHDLPCDHGNSNKHKVKNMYTCPTCHGAKKYDYGSKPTRIKWNGQPIKFLNGKLIHTLPTTSQLERMMSDVVEQVTIAKV